MKTVKDYLNQMYDKYPNVPKSDINKIINYGCRELYLYNVYGGDVLINTPKIWFYCGYLFRDSLVYWEYYKKKLLLKLRVFFRRNKNHWDGYYYFALNADRYREYSSQIHRRGRPKKTFTYGPVILFQNIDECKVKMFTCQYIFRVQYPTSIGTTIYFPNYISDKAELFLVRDPQKFKDILIINNKYDNI